MENSKEQSSTSVNHMMGNEKSIESSTKKQLSNNNLKIHPKPKKKPTSDIQEMPTDLQKHQSNKSSREFRPSQISEKYNESVIRQIKMNLKRIDTINAFFSCFGLLLAWIENDIFFNNNNVSSSSCHVLRGLVSCLCVIGHYYIFRHYKLKMELLKSQRIIYQRTKLQNSGLFKYYLIEILFNYFHCPPFFDFVLPNEQLGIHFDISLDAYISVIMLGRLYIFFRLFDHYSFWTGERANRVCRINGFSPNSKFALKAYLRYKPYIVLVICLGFSILLFGFALRTFERPYKSPSRRFNFDYMWNSFWCVIVTMTTIGYGDIYPQTHLGRLVIIIACIWGVFILSLFVVALNNTITLSKEESKAFEQITQKDSIKKGLEKDAITIIKMLMKLNLAKKHKIPINKKILMRMDLVGLVSRFKIKRKNALATSKKVTDILSEMHDEVNKEVGDVIENIQPLKKILPYINEAEEMQGVINDRTLQIFENSKKLMSLLITFNRGRLQESVKTLQDLEPRYDYLGNLIPSSDTDNAIPESQTNINN